MAVHPPRLKFIPFWKLTRWGCLLTFSENRRYLRDWLCGIGSDEFHNRSVYLILPLVGEVVFFYERARQYETEHFHGMSYGIPQGYLDEGCSECAELLGWMLMDQFIDVQDAVLR